MMGDDRAARNDNESPGEGLFRDLLELSAISTETIGLSTYRALLTGIIEAARKLFDAAAASVLILDRETEELVFEAAVDASVVGLRIPAHHGIAGWVVMTGEPIAVSDVRRDARFSADFAQATGYVPTSIMAAPLLIGEDVEGVIEVLDKKNSASFGLGDLDLLGLFARPIAIAVAQAQDVRNIGVMLLNELAVAAGTRGNNELEDALQRAISQGAGLDDDTLALTKLVQKIARRGERSRQLALEILATVERLT